MNFHLIFLLILLASISHLSSHHHHSYCFAIPKPPPDNEIERVKDFSSIDVEEELYWVIEAHHHHHHHQDGEVVKRKDLHEVHSGPNPIGNSIPKQKWKTTKLRIP